MFYIIIALVTLALVILFATWYTVYGIFKQYIKITNDLNESISRFNETLGDLTRSNNRLANKELNINIPDIYLHVDNITMDSGGRGTKLTYTMQP